MNITDFYPSNQWSIDQLSQLVTDQSTGKNYPYRAITQLTALHLKLTAATLLVQTAAAIAFIGLRILKLISFWHFWKDREAPYEFKARLRDAAADLLKIVTAPLSIIALQFVALSGAASAIYGSADSAYSAAKIYSSIEEFQHDRYLLSSFLNAAPRPPDSTKPTKPVNAVPSKQAIKRSTAPPKPKSANPRKSPGRTKKTSSLPPPKSQTQEPAPDSGIPEDPRFNWEGVPEDAKRLILHKLTPSLGRPKTKVIPSGLVNFAAASHTSKELAIQTKRDWADAEGVSLRAFGCKTAAEAIDYVIAHQFSSANLLDYPEVTDADLNRLIEARPNLEHLFINSKRITYFNLSHLTNLKSLDISFFETGCRKLLKDMEKIPDKVIGLRVYKDLHDNWDSERITVDELAQAIEKFTSLQSLDLSKYEKMNDSLAAAIGKLKTLQKLDLSFCLSYDNHISDKQLELTFQDLARINLEKLNLYGCNQVGSNVLAEYLPGSDQAAQFKSWTMQPIN